jgi:hypothetical protein
MERAVPALSQSLDGQMPGHVNQLVADLIVSGNLGDCPNGPPGLLLISTGKDNLVRIGLGNSLGDCLANCPSCSGDKSDSMHSDLPLPYVP